MVVQLHIEAPMGLSEGTIAAGLEVAIAEAARAKEMIAGVTAVEEARTAAVEKARTAAVAKARTAAVAKARMEAVEKARMTARALLEGLSRCVQYVSRGTIRFWLVLTWMR